MKRLIQTGIAAVLIFAFSGCAQVPDQVYMVEYQVIGDRSVKYLYIPGETSEAGQMFLDQSIGLEICSISVLDQQVPASEREAAESRCRTSRILRTQEYR